MGLFWCDGDAEIGECRLPEPGKAPVEGSRTAYRTGNGSRMRSCFSRPFGDIESGNARGGGSVEDAIEGIPSNTVRGAE